MLISDKRQSKEGRLELLCDAGGRTRTTKSKLQETLPINKEDFSTSYLNCVCRWGKTGSKVS